MQSKMIKLLYFARLKESLGLSFEEIAIPSEVNNVASLIQWLSNRGDVWGKEFSGIKQIRASINMSLVSSDAQIIEGDEIAFFPPVTGG